MKPNTLPPLAEMRRAVQAKDPAYDGIFYLGVRTTGIFCRPSCRARPPRLQNVEFFPTVKEAMFAGYRACKRCRPLESAGRPPAWAEQLVARLDGPGEERIRDADLRGMGLDPARVRRHFQRSYGMTFQAFARARRLGGALDELRRGADLDDVVFDHGYESHSGFRDAFAKAFGAPPGRVRTRVSAAACVRLAWMETPLGPMVAGGVDAGICFLEFTDRRAIEAQLRTLRRRFGPAVVPGENGHLAALRAQLAEYFAGRRRVFEVPLVAPGTPFQERVWAELRRIPYGETRSYEALARAVGAPGAVRAAGTANGANRIAILIPCHRVVNKNGRLGGYGGGLRRKELLLSLESGAGLLGAPGPGGSPRPTT